MQDTFARARTRPSARATIGYLVYKDYPSYSYLTIWRVSRKSYIRISIYMPWYHSKQHIWIYFLVFLVICQIWHIEISPNLHRLSVLKLFYYLESFKKIVYYDLQIYALVPLQITYLEIFSCVCSDISNLAHRKSPKLAQIIRLMLSYYLKSFKKVVY